MIIFETFGFLRWSTWYSRQLGNLIEVVPFPHMPFRLLRLLETTASADFSARLWDAVTGNQIHEFVHNHIVKSVHFASDRSKLATGGHEGILRIFDVASPGSATLEVCSCCSCAILLYLSMDEQSVHPYPLLISSTQVHVPYLLLGDLLGACYIYFVFHLVSFPVNPVIDRFMLLSLFRPTRSQGR